MKKKLPPLDNTAKNKTKNFKYFIVERFNRLNLVVQSTV